MNLNWKAVYKDGSSLSQFKGETECLFKEIDQISLNKFQLIDSEESVVAEVDFDKSIVYANGEEHKGPAGTKTLIYFRRNQVRVIEGKQQPPKIAHHLGYKNKKGDELVKIVDD